MAQKCVITFNISDQCPDAPPPNCDITDLQLIQVAAVFAILHHPSKHQQPCPVTHEAVGGAAGGDVTSYSRDEPLVGSCRGETSEGHFTATVHSTTHTVFSILLTPPSSIV